MRRCLPPVCLQIGLSAVVWGCGVPVPPTDDGPADQPVVSSTQLVPHHRITRVEYERAVVDLLGVDSAAVRDLPPDQTSSGMTPIADALTVSPVLVDRWSSAAYDAATLAANGEAGSDKTKIRRTEVELAGLTHGERTDPAFIVPLGSDLMRLWRSVDETVMIDAPKAGSYGVRFTVCDPSADELIGGWPVTPTPLVRVRLDGQVVFEGEAGERCGDPRVVEVWQSLTQGPHAVVFTLVNGEELAHVPTLFEATSMALDYVDLIGPDAGPPSVTAIAEAAAACPAETLGVCLGELVVSVAVRAWSRPLTEDEASGLSALVTDALDEQLDAATALAYGLRGVLLSPHFVFRIETHADERDHTHHPLYDHELATRLARALWSSVPDDALLACADEGSLSGDPDGACGLRTQAMRMLDDPRSASLEAHFLTEWLGLDELHAIFRQWSAVPQFDLEVAHEMEREVQAYFRHFVDHDVPFDDLLTARTTWVSDRLADYYGIPLPGTGPSLGAVELPDSVRGGVLQLGGVMAATGLEHRTSTALRARWLLQNFYCQAVGPPPPDVPALSEDAAGRLATDALDAHNEPACRGCHDVLDPLGLAFENYDQGGAWRDQSPSGETIEVDVELRDGTQIRSATELAEAMQRDPVVRACMVRKVAAWLTGDDVSAVWIDAETRAHVDTVVAEAEAANASFRSIVASVVASPLFTHREEDSP